MSSLTISTNSLITPLTTPLNTNCINCEYLSEKDYLLTILLDLDGVQQSPEYHPEVDALYHSLQVFQHAHNETNDPFMLTAALFHDVGKSMDMKAHALIGANMVRGILAEPVPWLIEHHLDLLLHPRQTRKKFKSSAKLKQLEMLRRCDLQGRETHIDVINPIHAIEIITQTDEIFQ